MATPAKVTPLSVLRAQLLPVALVFLLPLIALGFGHHALGRFDQRFIEAASARLATDSGVDPSRREALNAFIRRFPPSVACPSADPELADYRQGIREVCGQIDQFVLAKQVSLAMLALGVFMTLFGAALALLAYFVPRTQYLGFVIGWRAMQLFAAVETLAQGALAVWLSYWLTAFFFNIYVPKLILVVGCLAAFAAWHVIRGIFLRPPPPAPVEAVRVDEARAAGLFARIRELCSRVGTEAPTNLLVGIDDNFFVTEVGLPIRDGSVEGRSLFVSLPLLRVLDRDEADAVLAHEMGHFVGGDTAFTRRMGPQLAASGRYLGSLYQNVPFVFHFMRAYFSAFDLALARTERSREFAADALAARVVSGGALSRALLKIAAYASFRTRVEASLFGQDRKHDSLSIASRIAEGFAGYVQGPDFARDMEVATTPHPFDSHPRMEARMEAVGARIASGDYAATALRTPGETWLSAVSDVEAIEAKMWGEYEARFAGVHEIALAHRYLPSTPEEEELVLRHFPPRTFSSEAGEVAVSFREVHAPDWAGPLHLGEIDTLHVEERMFKKYLDLKTRDGAKRSVSLSKLGGNADPFLDTLAQYVGRQRAAQRHAASAPAKRDEGE